MFRPIAIVAAGLMLTQAASAQVQLTPPAADSKPAAKKDWAIVEEDVGPADFDSAESDAVVQYVVTGLEQDIIELGILR